MLGLDTVGGSLEIRRRVGFLPGDLALYPKLTGRRCSTISHELRGGVDERVRDASVERFDADLDRRIRELSSGNRQKLGLIQAFMHEPELLILDEPIAGLDPLVQQSFHALLGEVSAEGRTVLLSSHTLSEVERVADRVAILRQGRLVVVDSLDNLRRVAVQRLEIEFGAPVDPREFLRLPGVVEVTPPARRSRAFEGSADALVKAAAAHEVQAIRPATTTSRRSSCATTGRTRDLAGAEADAAPAAARRRLRVDRGDRRDAAVGALFPAVGNSIGKLNLPKSVTTSSAAPTTPPHRLDSQRDRRGLRAALLGALAISGASAATAGEEEDRILALMLAYPIGRTRLVRRRPPRSPESRRDRRSRDMRRPRRGRRDRRAAASRSRTSAAVSLHLAFFGWAAGALALALGAWTGRRALATGVAAAFALLGWLDQRLRSARRRARPGSSTSRCSTTTKATTRSRTASTSSA